MVRTYVGRLTAALLLSATVVAGGVGLSTAQQAPAVETLQASNFATSCADLTGDAVETLENLLLEKDDADFRGLPSAMVVLQSESEVDLSMKSMLDSPHSIVIGDPNEPVACGDIGGYVPEEDDDDADDLEIGLMPWGDSGYFGVAHIDGDNNFDADADDDSATEIEVEVAVPNE